MLIEYKNNQSGFPVCKCHNWVFGTVNALQSHHESLEERNRMLEICNNRHKDITNGSEITFICLKPKNHGGLHQGERKQCNWEIDNYYCVKSPGHIDDHKTIRMQIDEDKLKKRNTKFQDGDKVRTKNPNTIYTIQGCDVRVNGVWYYLQGWSQPIHESELILIEKNEDLINDPKHYGGKDNPYEVIKVLKEWGLENDALLWTAGKYLGRAGKKEGESLSKDLKKLVYYVNKRIEELDNDDSAD